MSCFARNTTVLWWNAIICCILCVCVCVCIWSIRKYAVPCFTTVFPQLDCNKVWPGGDSPMISLPPPHTHHHRTMLSPSLNISSLTAILPVQISLVPLKTNETHSAFTSAWVNPSTGGKSASGTLHFFSWSQLQSFKPYLWIWYWNKKQRTALKRPQRLSFSASLVCKDDPKDDQDRNAVYM